MSLLKANNNRTSSQVRLTRYRFSPGKAEADAPTSPVPLKRRVAARLKERASRWKIGMTRMRDGAFLPSRISAACCSNFARPARTTSEEGAGTAMRPASMEDLQDRAQFVWPGQGNARGQHLGWRRSQVLSGKFPKYRNYSLSTSPTSRWREASARNWRALTAFTFLFIRFAVSSMEYPCPKRRASTFCCSGVNFA